MANKWTASVIHGLGSGSKRPSELMQRLNGISQKMLTQTLRRMERSGLVTRKVYPVVPPRVEYTLTPLALTLVEPIEVFRRWARVNMAAIQAWERQCQPDGDGPKKQRKSSAAGARRSGEHPAA